MVADRYPQEELAGQERYRRYIFKEVYIVSRRRAGSHEKHQKLLSPFVLPRCYCPLSTGGEQ